jgi:hypothetical protein
MQVNTCRMAAVSWHCTHLWVIACRTQQLHALLVMLQRAGSIPFRPAAVSQAAVHGPQPAAIDGSCQLRYAITAAEQAAQRMRMGVSQEGYTPSKYQIWRQTGLPPFQRLPALQRSQVGIGPILHSTGACMHASVLCPVCKYGAKQARALLTNNGSPIHDAGTDP